MSPHVDSCRVMHSSFILRRNTHTLGLSYNVNSFNDEVRGASDPTVMFGQICVLILVDEVTLSQNSQLCFIQLHKTLVYHFPQHFLPSHNAFTIKKIKAETAALLSSLHKEQ